MVRMAKVQKIFKLKLLGSKLSDIGIEVQNDFLSENTEMEIEEGFTEQEKLSDAIERDGYKVVGRG